MLGSGGYVRLLSHKSITDRLNLNKLYKLSRPGKYTIQVNRYDDAKTLVKSNIIAVTLAP